MKHLMTRLFALLLLSALFLSVLTSCEGFLPGDETEPEGGDTTKGDGVTTTAPTPPDVAPVEIGEDGAYISLDINPGVALTVDADGKVSSVYAENEDGRVLLYEETGIVGADYEDAVDKIVSLAIELGYLSEENSVVTASVTMGDDTSAEALLASVDSRITATAEAVGLAVTTDVEGAFSLLRDMDKMKDKFPDNPRIQALTPAKYQLALSASETGEVSLRAAVEMDSEELIEILDEAYVAVEEFATEEYNRKKTEALLIYETAHGAALDAVYLDYYTTPQNIMAHRTTAHLGGLYFMYSVTARGFALVADVLSYIEEIGYYELEEAQVSALMTALGMDTAEIEKLKDSEGKITIASIESYVDILFKNMPASTELELKKAAFSAALLLAEEQVMETVRALAAEYATEIREVIALGEEGIALMEMYAFTDAAKADVAAAKSEFERVRALVESLLDGNVPTEEELREHADDMREHADGIYERIEEDLDDSEKQVIEDKKKDAEESVKDERDRFDEELRDAEEEAREHLRGQKEERKNKNNGNHGNNGSHGNGNKK